MSNSNMEMPEGLSYQKADAIRRRRRNGSWVDREEGIREVVDLFGRYVHRALQPLGPSDLRAVREELRREHDSAIDLLGDRSAKRDTYEGVHAAADDMCNHFGPDTLVQDTVNELGGLDFGGAWWTVSTEMGLNGAPSLVNLHLRGAFGQEDRGREGGCVHGRRTWAEAVRDAATGLASYRSQCNTLEDEVEETGLRERLIDHVLSLHRRDALPWPSPTLVQSGLPTWEHVQSRLSAIQQSSNQLAKRAAEELDYLTRVRNDFDHACLFASPLSSDEVFTLSRVKELLEGSSGRLDDAVRQQIRGVTFEEPDHDDKHHGEIAGISSAPVFISPKTAKEKWGPLAAFIDRALATVAGRGQAAEAMKLWSLLQSARDPVVLEFCSKHDIDEDSLLALSPSSWSDVRGKGLAFRARDRSIE